MKFDNKNHPIITNLKSRIADCKYQLLNILEEWYHLQNVIQPKLIFTYESLFGQLENELRIKNQVAYELDKRVELLSIKIRKGEKISESTIKFVEIMIEKESERIKRLGNHSQNYNVNNSIPNCSVNDNYEIPQIYRKLVKRLHPDAVGEESPEYKKFWDHIQVAYQNRDSLRLRLYAQTLLNNEDTGIQDIHSERIKLNTEIRELEINIINAKNKLNMLKREEPFNLENKLNDHIWVATKQRNLKEKIFYLDRKIDYKERMLKSLTNGQYIAEKTENGSVRFVKREITMSYAAV